MTIKQLIEEFKKYPEDVEVRPGDSRGDEIYDTEYDVRYKIVWLCLRSSST